ncbi:DUF7673 family protein [Paracoccus aerius]|uniref:DUF7673 domain-containing protein n=1 Tax=Paracoccus aerius TaxID=1915382 RepID=A0ABS1SAD1_9RHOB|nr:hypothetical protein [Paracoccus aerius]MBL3675696.1 hypothetical protein [Paracoccus aerius]GHG36473.1 hypothetical protein GCM10017322_39190 [Paracoccus aerius]
MPPFDLDDAAPLTDAEVFAQKRARFQGRTGIYERGDYAAAVGLLLALTRLHSGTGSASRAAQVLLNAYNGSRFPYDPGELYYLDPDLRTAAFALMWGRIVTGRGPHEFLNTPEAPTRGSEIFEGLAEDYPRQFKRIPPEECEEL